jgi:hypothetical protein
VTCVTPQCDGQDTMRSSGCSRHWRKTFTFLTSLEPRHTHFPSQEHPLLKFPVRHSR